MPTELAPMPGSHSLSVGLRRAFTIAALAADILQSGACTRHHRFEIFGLADPTHPTSLQDWVNDRTLWVQPPLLTDKDVVGYDPQTLAFRLEPGVTDRLQRLNDASTNGVHADVVVDGELAYPTCFFGASSRACRMWPELWMDGWPPRPKDTLVITQPRNPSGYQVDAGNAHLSQAFTALGKVRQVPAELSAPVTLPPNSFLVTVVGPDGKPVPRARVEAIPNAFSTGPVRYSDDHGLVLFQDMTYEHGYLIDVHSDEFGDAWDDTSGENVIVRVGSSP